MGMYKLGKLVRWKRPSYPIAAHLILLHLLHLFHGDASFLVFAAFVLEPDADDAG